MSSYMLVVNQATIQSRTNKSISDASSRSGTSSGSSISYNASNTGSVQFSGKKIFDPVTMRYVARESIINLESRIQKYEAEFKALINKNKYHSINERMNRYYYDSSKILFTIENVDILRYTYFESISDDFNLIKTEIKKTTSTGDFSLNYMNKLRNAGGKFNKKNSLISKSSPATTSFRINDYKSINTFDEISIGSQFRSKQFWNNVYQDIRALSQDEVNYFDLLPPINQCLDFFSEYFDYALYNLLLLEGDGTQLNDADRIRLSSYTFFYYDDEHIEKFKEFKQYLIEIYQKQRDLSVIFNKSRDRLTRNQKKENQDSYIELNKILTDVIIENLKASLHSAPSNSKNELFSIWSEFLRYHLVELMMKESFEPQYFMNDMDTDDSVSDFNNYIISRTSSTIMRNRNFGQSSKLSNSSSKVSYNSNEYPTRPNSPLSDTNMSNFQPKWGSMTGIPPIEPYYDDSKSVSLKKTKKKSIFSKFLKKSDGH